MELRPAALRFVLEQGLSAVIVVSGRSMEPTIPLGTRVDVAPLSAGAAPAVGEIVLVATAAADVLVLHRVMHVSSDGDLVIHQGDAGGAAFATCARRDVLARMTGFADVDVAARPVPLPENLPAAARARFRRRRLACVAFARARTVARALSVEDHPLVRRCGVALRKLARRLGR
jgi:hypothetical protein